MRLIVFTRRMLWRLLMLVGFTLVAIALVVSLKLSLRDINVFSVIAERDKYETRSYLLMQSTTQIGVSTPEEAVDIWALGLKMRSAALQYAVMTTTLRDEYARQLEHNAPNWVTGMSSPWVDSYKVIKVQVLEPDRRIFELRVFTMSSTPPDAEYGATLTVTREGKFWRILHIEAEEGLYSYMGYKP